MDTIDINSDQTSQECMTEICKMNVFISWSGERGKHIAKTLRKWIPYIIQTIEPWMSDQDIEPGTRWASELAKTLDRVNFGIICLTPETINTPWVLFEAGAMAKSLHDAVVCPYLTDLEPGDLKGPLNQFNALLSDKDGTLSLFRSMNRSMPAAYRIREEVLEETFALWWPKVEADLKNIPSAPAGHSILQSDTGFGLEYVSESRGPALEIFAKYLEAEIQRKEDGRVSMIGTSMRGFLVYAGSGFNGRGLLEKAVENKTDLRFMMVNPKIADLRSPFEARPPGNIPGEIWADVAELRGLGLPRESVKFYEAGPTVFGIATSDRMLLNPYPLCLEAHAGFTLIARKTNQRMDIYQQYMAGHFDKLWDDHSRIIPDRNWEKAVENSTDNKMRVAKKRKKKTK